MHAPFWITRSAWLALAAKCETTLVNISNQRDHASFWITRGAWFTARLELRNPSPPASNQSLLHRSGSPEMLFPLMASKLRDPSRPRCRNRHTSCANLEQKECLALHSPQTAGTLPTPYLTQSNAFPDPDHQKCMAHLASKLWALSQWRRQPTHICARV